MLFNLIGPGRLGQALIASLISTGEHKLCAVYHPKLIRAQQAVETLGQGTPITDLTRLPDADITFITCPDDKMQPLVEALAAASVVTPGSMVIHLSGILSSDLLMPLKKQGVSIASVHPLKAFRKTITPETTAFQGIHCTIEGDDAATNILIPLWRAMGADVFTLNSEKKTSYHAAAVMASNYLVTLAAEASTLFQASGLSQKDAHNICTQLMQTSLNNLKQTDTPHQALTGPLLRGDVQTIQQHLDAISSEKTNMLYRAAGLATLPLIDLSTKKRELLENVLNMR